MNNSRRSVRVPVIISSKQGIHARNLRMAESLLYQLENKTVFAAVGALHLPGEKGLLNILRRTVLF